MPTVKRLVIDDNRTFDFEADHARTVIDALIALDKVKYEEIWWDHDLGTENGGDTIGIANYLVSKRWNLDCKMIVHTANPVGRANLVAILGRLYTVEELPFTHLKDYLVKDTE